MSYNFKDLTLTCISNIQKAIRNNRLVLFVGAGISVNSGAPSWHQLIVEMGKELGINKEKFSQDEFLKIPQYYFNEYKDAAYKRKINEIFNVDLIPNPINELIFELNPAYVITTNYDNLLEQVAPASYSVIRKNSEMPYVKTHKSIIKMHGDFEADNVVLKEDDYLNYSDNFKLIETFVKSIIATHTVVFVGYSVNDYNVNLIFQWVKEVLGKDHHPAYLLDASVEQSTAINSRLIYDYYKEKNIYQLSYNQIKDEINSFWEKDKSIKAIIDTKFQETKSPIQHPVGKTTYELLSFIKYYYSDETVLDYYYEKLSLLKNLNSYFNFDIENLLSDGINKYYTTNKIPDLAGYQLSSGDNRFEVLIKEIENNLQYLFNSKLQKKDGQSAKNEEVLKKLHFICDIFANNAITKLYHPSSKSVDLLDYVKAFEGQKYSQASDYIFQFNYKALNDYIERCDYSPNTYANINVFEKAYSYYKLLEYEKAYSALKEVSECFKANYFIYSVAEFNKKALYDSIWLKRHNYEHANEDNLDTIMRQIDQIDLKKIFNDYSFLPYKNLLEDKLNFGYLNEVAASINDQIITIQKTKDNVERGGFALNPAVNELFEKIHKIFMYTMTNFLLIEHEKQVKTLYYLFVDSILKSYSIQQNDRSEMPSLGCSKVEEFSYFEIYIMVEYIKPNDLCELFSRYNIKELKLKSDEDDNVDVKKGILMAFQNLCTSMIELYIKNEAFWNRVNNFLAVLAKIEHSKEDFATVVNGLLNVYGKLGFETDRNCGNKSLVFLNYYLKSPFLNPKTIDFNVLAEFLNFILHESKNLNAVEIQLLDFDPVVATIINIFVNSNMHFDIEQESIIGDLLVPYENARLDKFISIVIPLYKFLPDDTKGRIKEYLDGFFQSYFSFELYYNACFYDIIESNNNLEKLAVASISEMIKKRDNQPTVVNYVQDLKFLFSTFSHLIVSGKIKNLAGLTPFNRSESNFYDFLVDMSSFDYRNRFNFSFLIGLPPKLRNKLKKIISKNTNIGTIIKDKFSEYLKQNSSPHLERAYSAYQDLFKD